MRGDKRRDRRGSKGVTSSCPATFHVTGQFRANLIQQEMTAPHEYATAGNVYVITRGCYVLPSAMYTRRNGADLLLDSSAESQDCSAKYRLLHYNATCTTTRPCVYPAPHEAIEQSRCLSQQDVCYTDWRWPAKADFGMGARMRSCSWSTGSLTRASIRTTLGDLTLHTSSNYVLCTQDLWT